MKPILQGSYGHDWWPIHGSILISILCESLSAGVHGRLENGLKPFLWHVMSEHLPVILHHYFTDVPSKILARYIIRMKQYVLYAATPQTWSVRDFFKWLPDFTRLKLISLTSLVSSRVEHSNLKPMTFGRHKFWQIIRQTGDILHAASLKLHARPHVWTPITNMTRA